MNWFTADHHFGHSKIIEYCNRPFESSAEMDEYMIEQWNSVVGKFDVVYHLGDFSLTGKNKTYAILEELNGKKYLFRGSHDKSAIKCGYMFEHIYTSGVIGINGWSLFLSHHCHKVWPKSHYNVPHIFGHSHGGLDDYAESEGKLLDVGVDSHDFKPWSFGEVMAVMDKRPDNFNFVGK